MTCFGFSVFVDVFSSIDIDIVKLTLAVVLLEATVALYHLYC